MEFKYVSNPAKTTRVKSAKTGVGLGKQFARKGYCIYVLGTAIESRIHHLPYVS